MGLILVDFPMKGKSGGEPRPRPVAGLSTWQVVGNWLVIVGCAVGAAYVFAGAAGWL